MKRTLLLALLFSYATLVQADTEFEDTIPIDLAKILLSFGNTTDVVIYSDVLENFPEFEIPAGFNVLGSMDQGPMQRVVLQTNMEVEEAENLLLATLAGSGWQELQRPDSSGMQPRGFVPAGGASPQRLPLSVCHDDHGTMTLTVAAGVNGSIVSMLQNNNSMLRGISGCDQQNQQMAQSFGMRGTMAGGVREHMPALQMPEQTANPANNPRATFVSGSGGSRDDFETRSHLGIDWAIATLYEFFAEQLEEQGWAQDSAWTGSITAGGNWTKSPEQNLDLVTILSIVEIAEDAFELKLRVISRGAQATFR